MPRLEEAMYQSEAADFQKLMLDYERGLQIVQVSGGDAFEIVELLQKVNKLNRPLCSPVAFSD